MDNHKDKATADIFKNILVTDLRDAFPEVAKLAGIILVSPIGTAVYCKGGSYCVKGLRQNICLSCFWSLNKDQNRSADWNWLT